MEQILRCALRELEQGQPAVLAVITAAHGSTPRGAGAAMLVGQAGLLAGTIGGGALEHACVRMAFAPEKNLVEFSLDNRQAAGLGMACGGSAQVLFAPLHDRELLAQALEITENIEPGWLLLPLSGGAPILEREGLRPCAEVLNRAGEAWISLPLSKPSRVFIFGGGHVAYELAQLLDVLAYPYVVMDDRSEFSNSDRFPRAKKVITGEFTELDNILTGKLCPGPSDCLCVMTRGHLSDMDVLRFALKTKAGYIGLMGSRRKREYLFGTLAEEGFLDVAQRVVVPIGLNIGGQTPAEVAVSVAAQLVQHRNQ